MTQSWNEGQRRDSRSERIEVIDWAVEVTIEAKISTHPRDRDNHHVAFRSVRGGKFDLFQEDATLVSRSSLPRGPPLRVRVR